MTEPPAPGAARPARPILAVEGATRRFGQTVAVDRVDLVIDQGEFFALLGESGCGKTTLLRMIAGFELPDEGRIVIDGQDVSQVPPYERPVNMVFQSYALFPHMSVAQNVAYGLKQEGMARSEREDRVADVLALVELSALAKRKPHQYISPVRDAGVDYRAASGNGWRWPAAWRSGQRSCCWTSRWGRSTGSCGSARSSN